MNYRIKNWSRHQHFKDRRPPWIKLYRDLLDDHEWHSLEPEAAKMLVMLWLLASENEGNLPEIKTISFRLRVSEDVVSTSLLKLNHWLETGDACESVNLTTTAKAKDIAKNNGYGSRHISDKVKRDVWLRDRGICIKCGAFESIEFDHIIPVSKGGESGIDNIQLLCRPCNRSKRARLHAAQAEPIPAQAEPIPAQAEQLVPVADIETPRRDRVEESREETETETETENTIKEKSWVDGFEEFWNAYPEERRKNRYRTESAWSEVRHNLPPVSNLLNAVEAFKHSKEWKQDNGKFIPSPWVWLQERRWQDAPAYTPKPKSEEKKQVPLVNETDARAWLSSEGYEGMEDVPFNQWPLHVQKQYLKTKNQPQAIAL
jgi:hypothetical protein